MPPQQFALTLALLALLFVVAWLFFRYKKQQLLHQERMTALEKGAAPPVLSDLEKHNGAGLRVYLLRGMIWLSTGITLTVFLAAAVVTSHRPMDLEQQLWRTQRLKELGATEEQIRQELARQPSRRGPPVGLALIGMVPAGVGLAYLVFYRSEKQRALPQVRNGSSLTPPSLG
jgi:hypothetical protein